MNSVKFFVPGKPRGKGRPRFSGGRVYTDEATRAYEREIAERYWGASRGFRFPDDAFLAVNIRQEMPMPKRASMGMRARMLDGYEHPPAKPDLDNVIKVVLDGLNGEAYKDDARVICICAGKFYSTTPGVSVEITRVD